MEVWRFHCFTGCAFLALRYDLRDLYYVRFWAARERYEYLFKIGGASTGKRAKRHVRASTRKQPFVLENIASDTILRG